MKRQTLWAVTKAYQDDSTQTMVTTLVDGYYLYASKEAAQAECNKYNTIVVENFCSLYFQTVRFKAHEMFRGLNHEFVLPEFKTNYTQRAYYYPTEVTITIYD